MANSLYHSQLYLFIIFCALLKLFVFPCSLHSLYCYFSSVGAQPDVECLHKAADTNNYRICELLLQNGE